MGQKMSKAPVFYNVGQIQFSPVLGMAKYVPAIQDSLRANFPDFRQDHMAALRLVGPGAPSLPTETIDRWHFIDRTKTSGYLLRQESLVFHTTAYETSEPFFERLLAGIKLVNEVANLGYVESVSVRALDAVVPDGGKKLSDYLNPVLRGLAGELEGQLRQSVAESVWDIPPSGILISRITIAIGNLAFPMDLFPLPLELKKSLVGPIGEHALLDNDRQERERFAFDESEIKRRFQKVKNGMTEAFLKEVTQMALDQWR